MSEQQPLKHKATDFAEECRQFRRNYPAWMMNVDKCSVRQAVSELQKVNFSVKPSRRVMLGAVIQRRKDLQRIKDDIAEEKRALANEQAKRQRRNNE